MFEFNSNIWDWIECNIEEDPNKLRLKYATDVVKMAAIDQIDCRQRTFHKLQKTIKNSRFIFPTTLSAEQCTSDALADFHASLLPENASVLDMTCGLGIDTFHFAKRATSVISCELSSYLAETAQYNALKLGHLNVRVVNCNSVDFIRDIKEHFDCIFIDPARRGEYGKRLFALSQCSPDVTEIIDRLLQLSPLVIIKASPMLDIAHTIAELHSVKHIIATGNNKECKELLIICCRNYAGNVSRSAVVVDGNGCSHSVISFSEEDENNSIAQYSVPSVGDILYEPFVPVIKIAPYKFFCNQFNVTKLAPGTHLYFGHTYNKDVPARAMNILEILDMNKRTLSEISCKYPRIDVTTRNIPIQADELTKRLKVKPSGSIRLFAVTVLDGDKSKKILLVTESVRG